MCTWSSPTPREKHDGPPRTGRLLTGLLGAQQGCGAETFTREEVSGERDQQRSRKASGERACLPNSTRTRRLRSGDFAGAGPGEQPKRTLETLPGSVRSKQILLIRYPMGSKEGKGPGSPHGRGGTACSQGQRYRPQCRQCHSPPLPGNLETKFTPGRPVL